MLDVSTNLATGNGNRNVIFSGSFTAKFYYFSSWQLWTLVYLLPAATAANHAMRTWQTTKWSYQTKSSWPNFQEIVRQGNFHEKSVLSKLTALYEPAVWLNTKNCFLPTNYTSTRWRLKQHGKYYCPTIRLPLKIPKMSCDSGASLSTVNRKRHQLYIVRLTAISNLSRAVKKTFVSEMFRQSSHQSHCLLPSSDQQPGMISASAMPVRRKFESTTQRRQICD